MDKIGVSGWGELLQLAYTAASAVLFVVALILAVLGRCPSWLFFISFGAAFLAALINHIDADRTGRPLPPY